jgi:hypothetical protein
MEPLAKLEDPDALDYVADAFGRPMAAVYIDDLGTWSWALERTEALLAHASAEAQDDYARFVVADRYGPCDGPSLGEVSWVLSAMAVRLRRPMNGGPK